MLQLDRLYPRYGFPNHLLVELNNYDFRVRDVPIRPVYNVGEVSGIRLPEVVPTLSWLLVKCYFWRMKEKYIIRDFHPLVFFLALGLLLDGRRDAARALHRLPAPDRGRALAQRRHLRRLLPDHGHADAVLRHVDGHGAQQGAQVAWLADPRGRRSALAGLRLLGPQPGAQPPPARATCAAVCDTERAGAQGGEGAPTRACATVARLRRAAGGRQGARRWPWRRPPRSTTTLAQAGARWRARTCSWRSRWPCGSPQARGAGGPGPRAKKRVLMVGHILEYHPAIRKLKELVDAGELGEIHYVYSNRLNLGKVRQRGEHPLELRAPRHLGHPAAAWARMPGVGRPPAGQHYLQHEIADVTMTCLAFPGKPRAHIFVSWLHPFKEQKLVVIGSRKMAVFDDVVKEGKLKIFDKGIEWTGRAAGDPADRRVDALLPGDGAAARGAAPLRRLRAHAQTPAHRRRATACACCACSTPASARSRPAASRSASRS